MPLLGASESFIMKKKLYIIPLFLTLFSFVIIYLSLQLDTSPEMIVGDSMQARSFPIFLMVINLLLVGILSLQFYKTYPKEVELEKFPTWSSMLLFLIFYIIIFISVNAVSYAEEHFDELFSDSSKVFAVGPATANQLLKKNIAVDCFPKKKCLKSRTFKNQRMFRAIE